MMSAGEQAAGKVTAMLMMAGASAIDGAKIVAKLRRQYPAECGDAQLVPNPTPGTTNMIVVAGHIIAVLRRDQALPDGWQAVAQRTAHWPEAEAVCAGHTAHVILAPMGEVRSMLAASRLLTAIAGAIVATHPGAVLAVLWNSSVLNSAPAWLERSPAAFAAYPNYPHTLWVAMRLFKDRSFGVVSEGLGRFVGREIEMTGDALLPLVERAEGLAAYLIEKGLVLRDGSTFGASEAERFAVRLRKSSRFAGLDVIAADLGALAAL